ncbi:putative exostosin [Helianthus annuus]|nr:putative exostosin [Helianthus annuus]
MWFGLTRSTELTGSTQSTRVNPVDSVNWLTQSRSTQSNGQRLDAKIGKDFTAQLITCAGISAKKEAPVNFLTDPLEGRSTLRPVDILVFGWVGGKHACVDLTGVSPLVGLGGSAFTVGQAALKAASSKVTKHEKACLDNQHVFISFAFDTFGFLAPEAVDLLSRVQRVMHSNVMTPRSMNVVFKRLSFAIQKGVAAQLVARLPTISM